MKIQHINPTDSIGNTLSTINLNYSTVEYNTFNIQASSEAYWYPMLSYYKSYGKFLKDATSISQKYSASFIQTATLVERNSSIWIKPITIFYPSVLAAEVLKVKSGVTYLLDWVKKYFPEYSLEELFKSKGGIPNYVENQMLIVYLHSWQYGKGISENSFIVDSTLCQTSNKSVCSYCIDRYYGYVYCSNGNMNCEGQGTSCQRCGTLRCSYSAPPYNSYVPPPVYVYKDIEHTSTVPVFTTVGFKRGLFIRYVPKVVYKPVRWITRTLVQANKTDERNSYGSITANVEMSFQDRQELDNITAVVFKIKNCQWTFDKFISY